MLNRLITIKPIPVAVLLLLYSCSSKQVDVFAGATEAPYKVLVLQHGGSDTSWGYIILHNNRQMIRQFSVPAMEGNRAFAGEEQASLTGNLVATKLNHGQSPVITKKELDSLGIIQLTHAEQNK